jgi:Zn ribbon nucleic-acid-binding protein
MSGNSSQDKCPRCQRENSYFLYTDWKPFDIINGECVACGFINYTVVYKVGKKDLEIMRDNNLEEGEKVKPLSKKELAICKEFDKAHLKRK